MLLSVTIYDLGPYTPIALLLTGAALVASAVWLVCQLTGHEW